MNKQIKQRLINSISWLLNKDKILIQLILETEQKNIGDITVSVFSSELKTDNPNKITFDEDELKLFFKVMSIIYNNYKLDFIIESTPNYTNSFKVPTLNKYVRVFEPNTKTINEKICEIIDNISTILKLVFMR